MPDHKAIDALTGGDAGKKLFEIIAAKDVVPLAWGENGFRELTNSKRAIRKPDDLKGLKIRVVGSPLFNETFTALGANPTQMSWADAQPALSTGAVDGQENPLTIFTAAKLHTVGQKHVTLWGYVADPLIFAVSKQVWELLGRDQKIVREAAVEAGKYGSEIARKGITDGRPVAPEGNRGPWREDRRALAPRSRRRSATPPARLRQVEGPHRRRPGDGGREGGRGATS